MNNERGFILLLTFIFMIVLTALVGSLLFMVTYETRDIGAQMDDSKLLNLAEAGIQRAMREIRDDYTSTTQQGIAYLRGTDYSASQGVDNPDGMRYFDVNNGNIDNNSDIAVMRTFDSNYTNTRLINISIAARVSRGTTGTGNPTMLLSYTINGVTGATTLSRLISSTSEVNYSVSVTGDRAWTWSTIFDPINIFDVRVQRIAGGRPIKIDAIYLVVTYGIDTATEPWYTGSYASFPISLGSGTIQSVSIGVTDEQSGVHTDEQGKVHLNTASQTLLRYLMEERGIASATANTLATAIVNYRSTNNFDSTEELLQVTGMTTTDYNFIKDYVTVYSFINTNVYRPSGARAPININTAPREVLRAVFDDPALALGATDAARLTTDIINVRATTPFTCFYTADTAVTTDFYGFVNSRGYLTAARRNRILDNADASSLISVGGGFAGFSCVTTEFAYAGTAFCVNSLANLHNRGFRVRAIIGNDGSHTFTNYIGDTTMVGWRKENFE